MEPISLGFLPFGQGEVARVRGFVIHQTTGHKPTILHIEITGDISQLQLEMG